VSCGVYFIGVIDVGGVGKARQGDGWMDRAWVGLAVDECVRRSSHDGMDIGFMDLGEDKIRSRLSYGTRYLGNSRTSPRAITRDNYTRVPQTTQKRPFSLPFAFSSSGFLQIIAMHVWPSLEKNGRRRREEEKHMFPRSHLVL